MSNDVTKQYTDLVQQSQQAVMSAVEAWTKTVQEAFASVPTSVEQFDAGDSVDKIFDFTEKVLEMQRDFTKKLIASSAQAAENAKNTMSDVTNTTTS